MSITARAGLGPSQDPRLGLSCPQQGASSHLGHHLLPSRACVSRELESEVKSTLKAGSQEVHLGIPSLCTECLPQTRCPSDRVPFGGTYKPQGSRGRHQLCPPALRPAESTPVHASCCPAEHHVQKSGCEGFNASAKLFVFQQPLAIEDSTQGPSYFQHCVAQPSTMECGGRRKCFWDGEKRRERRLRMHTSTSAGTSGPLGLVSLAAL